MNPEPTNLDCTIIIIIAIVLFIGTFVIWSMYRFFSIISVGADFNDSVIEIVFPADAIDISIPITDSIIVDDQINEVQVEGFVLVLEIVSSDNDVALTENMDVLVFFIFDNDSMLPHSGSVYNDNITYYNAC